nr:TIR domain-containing adapter molecule 1-like [Dasypus novemcinctus]
MTPECRSDTGLWAAHRVAKPSGPGGWWRFTSRHPCLKRPEGAPELEPKSSPRSSLPQAPARPPPPALPFVPSVPARPPCCSADTRTLLDLSIPYRRNPTPSSFSHPVFIHGAVRIRTFVRLRNIPLGAVPGFSLRSPVSGSSGCFHPLALVKTAATAAAALGLNCYFTA